MSAVSVIRTARSDAFVQAALASGIGVAPFRAPAAANRNDDRRWPLLRVVGGRASGR